MKSKFFSTPFRSVFRRTVKPLAFGALVFGLAATTSWAQDKEPKKEVSEKVSEAMGGPLKTAKEAKNWAEALRQLDALIASSDPNSYDRAILQVDKAQTLFQTGNAADLTKAIEPLEAALQLGDKYGYFDRPTLLNVVLSLAQLYGTEAQSAKQGDLQRQLYSKAYSYVRRYLDESKQPNPDLVQFAASILLSQSQLGNDKVDLGLVKQAQVEIEKGLRMSVKPKEQFYTLLLVTFQQQGDYKHAAEILELLVKMAPNNKTYWQQLAATYVQIEEPIRAIITIERAQQYGVMTDKKDNYSLFGLYFNIKQYDKAIELLHNGLRNGTIENDQNNWLFLAAAYQQVHKEPQAIDALKEGSKSFPKSGALDLQIAQLYYSLDKTNDAYNFVKSAIQKGVDKPASAYLLLAYFAYELKKLDEAVEAADKAVKLDPKSKDAQRMLQQFKDAVKERDAARNAPL